jgi:hypothetical protein
MIRQKLRTVDSLAQLFLGSGLWLYVVVFYLVFAGVAAIEASLMEWAMPEDAKDPKFLNLMLDVQFIVSFVYFVWLRNSTEGYTSAAESYLTLCSLASTFASQTLTLTENNCRLAFYHAHSGKVTLRPPPPREAEESTDIDEGLEKERAQEVYKLLDAVRDTCVAIVWYGYRAWDPTDHEQEPRLVERVEAYVKHREMDVVRLEHMLCLLLLSLSKELKQLGELDHGELQMLSSVHHQLTTHVRSLEVGSRLVTPGIFQQHLNVILFVAFVVYTPYSMWHRIGYWPTIIVYPLIMYLLAAPTIYRSWIGESFDPKGRFKYMDHKRDRVAYAREILTCYSDQHLLHPPSSLPPPPPPPSLPPPLEKEDSGPEDSTSMTIGGEGEEEDSSKFEQPDRMQASAEAADNLLFRAKAVRRNSPYRRTPYVSLTPSSPPPSSSSPSSSSQYNANTVGLFASATANTSFFQQQTPMLAGGPMSQDRIASLHAAAAMDLMSFPPPVGTTHTH